MLTLDTMANFTWSFHDKWFLATDNGNYVWSDPEYYGGTNEIVRFDGTYHDWIKFENIPFGRCKGKHTIGNYCGKDVSLPHE